MSRKGEVSMNRRNGNKEQQWKLTIREAARSGMSISEFCRRHKLREKQFYWWRQRLAGRLQSRRRPEGKQASFALVSDEHGSLDAGIELVLGDGRRLRISKGVDEETLRAVLSAVGSEGC
jgi:transposase-like protein